MRGVIIHAPKDLRIEEVASVPPGPREVRVGIEAGGICGSDLHYYHHGGFGTVRLQQPMALGHEIAGTVEEVGSRGFGPGARACASRSTRASPAAPAAIVARGQRNQCLDMQFMGSAMRFPHVQGGFRQSVTVDADQAIPIAPAHDDGRSRHGGAAGRLPPCRGQGRLAARRAGAGDGLRSDRRPRHRRRAAMAAQPRSSPRT